MLPWSLRSLDSSNPDIRKARARSLVGTLNRDEYGDALRAFEKEDVPDVYKWLALALARTGNISGNAAIETKLKYCSDSNARHWLLAAKAVLSPLTAQVEASAMLTSKDPESQLHGAIKAWGTRNFTPQLYRLLLNSAGEQADPDIRRWALLALHQHDIMVPVSILVDNVNSPHFLLSEWSLHVIAARAPSAANSAVFRLIERAPIEHPRVVEWGVHATAALNGHSEPLLIDVFRSVPDIGVREACVSEIARSPSQIGVDFLAEILETDPSPLLIVALLNNIGIIPESLAVRFWPHVERAVGSLQDETDIFGALTSASFLRNALSISQQRQLQSMLANTPVRIAARMLLNSPNNETGAARMKELTVGVIVALDEEFKYYNMALGGGFTVQFERDGSTNYLKRLEWPRARPVVLISRVIGRKGPEHASVAATQLIANCSPDFLVSIGISGSMSSKVSIGDIVVADSITGYISNSRIVDSDVPGRYDFKAAGEPYRTDKWLCDRAIGVELEAPLIYEQWKSGTIALTQQAISEHGALRVKVVRGDLAAGPLVVASDNFKRWLLEHKRDYLAVDMESSGVATAAWSDALSRIRLLVLRGISDSADRNKSKLEEDSGGRIREVTMVCATRYLETILRHIASY